MRTGDLLVVAVLSDDGKAVLDGSSGDQGIGELEAR